MDIKVVNETEQEATVAVVGTITFKNSNELRAILVMLLRKYCGYNLREICEFLGNISQPTASYLSTHGLKYINNTEYIKIINEIKEICSY